MNMLKRTSDIHSDDEVLRFLDQALRRDYTVSRPKSKLGAEWVIQPEEI